MENNSAPRSRKPMPRWTVAVITAVISVVLTLALVAAAVWTALGRGGLSMVEGWLLAKYAFVETDADLDTAVDAALDSFIVALGDRWSYYLDEEDYQRILDNRANSYVGVGVTVSLEGEDGILVISVTPDGPAEEAGILAGDTIIAVNGQSLTGFDLNEASDLIKGEEGTDVTLTLRGEDGTVRDAVCTRRRLTEVSSYSDMLEENIGYIQLVNFYSGSAGDFRTKVDGLVEQGAESLIVDLRGNPGGFVTELTAILDYLLPEGPVFTQTPRYGETETYHSDAACVDLPMVVLVNAGSYSAAELLAAQLRESISAPIVGELTSGKGYVQNTFPLPNGGGIGISTARYGTGSGHSLIGEGIVPDVELTDPDEQLQAAIDLLKNP